MGGVRTHELMLDTHTLLWALTKPTKLSATARELITRRQTALFVSAASAWEIATKQRIGKLPQADVLVSFYHQHLARLGVESIPIVDDHSLLAGGMEWEHRDPFDRMIAAQCMSESLPLATADTAFTSLTGVRVIW